MKKYSKYILSFILFFLIIFFVGCKKEDIKIEKNIMESKEEIILGDSNIVDSSKWYGIDGLGREIPSDVKKSTNHSRLVGMFYWTWHWSQNAPGPYNLNNTVKANPTKINDPNWWKTNYPAKFFWWNEPIYGYYMENDDYVLRKHAELLADAGVDFVVFDCTNEAWTFHLAYENLLKVWKKAKEDGINVPKIAFMLQFISTSDYTNTAFKKIYDNLYNTSSDNYKKYSDLLFRLNGKPLLLMDPSGVTDASLKNVLNIFEIRTVDATAFVEGAQTNGHWGWQSAYPQAFYVRNGKTEETSVSVAQNANYVTKKATAMNATNVMNRSYAANNYSYSYQYRGSTIIVGNDIKGSTAKSTNTSLYGRNFQQQWDNAINIDPEIIFVTGWNEWLTGYFEDTVSSFENWEDIKFAFPDEYNDENSRDIEPSKGDLKDYYYYQLVENIRKYKGVSKQESQFTPITINNTGDWNNSNIISYNHYVGGNNRDIIGYGLTSDYKEAAGVKYTNKTFRNDIKKAKVTYDKSYVYFYVETVNKLTSYNSGNWMRLLIDTKSSNENSSDNWEEFEYIINRVTGNDKTLVLEKSTGGWNFTKVGDVSYKVNNNILEIKVPRNYLGFTGDNVVFSFKWCDNNLNNGDIMSLYTDGDAAPGGRYTFHFEGSMSYSNPSTVTPTPKTVIKGDVNGDGKINSLDYVLIRKHIMGTKLKSEQQKYADFNGDGKITTTDYVLIRKLIMGK